MIDPTSPLGDTLRLNAFLASREFYDVMQAYRWADQGDHSHPQETVDAYEAVKDALRAALVRAVPLGGWQPIDTLDDCDRDVILWTPSEALHTRDQRAAFPDLPGDMRVSSRRHWTWATHWMPLPPVPVEPAAPRDQIDVGSRWNDKYGREVVIVAVQGVKVSYRNTTTNRLAVSRFGQFKLRFLPVTPPVACGAASQEPK